MKLFLIHCGYYDEDLFSGSFESHVNFFLVAESVEEAKTKAKSQEEFTRKRMHIDGVQEVIAVNGYEIHLQKSDALIGGSVITSHQYRSLAPRKQ